MAAPAEAMAVTLRADFGQFEKALLKAQNQTDAKLNQIEKKFGRSNSKVRDEAKGMGGVFGDLQRQIGGAAGGLPGLGSGMGAVGIAGGVASVGVLALVGALRGVQDAAKFADTLVATANRIGVTAEALQELRYAADETDVPIADLEKGLEALNGTLGAFKTGIGAGRVTPVFEALGLTQADLANVENARDLLPILADRLGQVSSRAEQVQLAKKLGIEPLLPVLRLGSDEINRMAMEGRDLGLVMSNDVVQGLADTDRALERNKQQIDANIREMQAGMAPFFVWATNELAKLSRGIGDFFNGLRSAQGRSDRVLEKQIESGQERVNYATRQSRDTGRPMSQVQEGWVRELAEARSELSRRRAERQSEPAPSAADRTREGGFELERSTPAPSGGSRGGGRGGAGSNDAARQAEEALRRQRRFDDDLAGASEATMQAQAQLALTAEQRASIAIQLLDSDRQQRAIQLARQVTDGDITEAQKARLIEAEAGIWIARQANIAADLQRATSEDAARAADMFNAQAQQMIGVRQSNAATLEQRLALDLELLKLQQAERRQALERSLLVEGITDVQRRTLEAMLANLGEIEAGETRAVTDGASRGVQDARGIVDGIKERDALPTEQGAAMGEIDSQEASGVLTHQQAMEARARVDQEYWQKRITGEGTMLNALAGLANSSNKKLAALGKAAAIAQATIDGYLAIQAAWKAAPYPFNLPGVAITTAAVASNVAAIAGVGMADGGPVRGPGGPRSDVIPTMLSNGEYVINARDAARNRSLLDTINKGGVPGFANGGMVGRINAAVSTASAPRQSPSVAPVTFAPVIDARGADLAAVARLERVLDEQSRTFASRVNGVREKRAKYRLGRR